MSEERLIVEELDAFGVIRIVEQGGYRYLEFGDEVEQSCVRIGDPSWLEYDYSRAMLLGALCHSRPKRALFLGFGAGSVTQACLKYLPLEEVEAIELRPAIPRLAREHLRAHHADLLPRLRFIKVDAVGFDLAVLETLTPLIEQYRPYLHVEVFTLKRSLPGYRADLIGFLQRHGYELRKVEEAPFLEGTLITPENMAAWNSYDLFCIPR